MRLWLTAAVLLVSSLPVSAQENGVVFAAVLPRPVIDVTGWEIVTGEFETTEALGAYRFYVNPRYQGVYQVMRYRVQERAPSGDPERRHSSQERVVFVRNPGTREPLLCWVRSSPETASAWREVPAGTDEYRVEMANLMRILAVHRRALRRQGH